MYSQTFALGNFHPVWDHEQPDQKDGRIKVLAGKNFAWHTRGIFSAYASELGCSVPTPAAAATRHPGSFTVAKKNYHFFNDGVYAHAGGACIKVFECLRDRASTTLEIYKWSYAYVGTVHYFSHPEWSEIIYYDEHADTWDCFRADCWEGPVYGITHAENRLVVLLTDVVGWSMFDKGFDGFECSSYCGSGYQSLALIRYGCPFRVEPYADGWLTFTDMGIMLSQPITDLVPDPEGDGVLSGPVIYKHQELTFDNLAVGPCAIEHIDEKDVIWLSERGFWHLNRGALEPWQPEWSGWFRDHWRDYSTLRPLDDVMLTSLRPFGWLGVSFKQANTDHYTNAAMYQFDLDRWGSFDYDHHGFAWKEEDGVKSRFRPFFAYFAVGNNWRNITHGTTDNSYVKLGPVTLHAETELHEAENKQLLFATRVGLSKRPWVDNYQQHAVRGTEDFWQKNEREVEIPSEFDLYVSGTEDGVHNETGQTEPLTRVQRQGYTASYSGHVTGYSHLFTFECANATDFFDIRTIQASFIPVGI